MHQVIVTTKYHHPHHSIFHVNKFESDDDTKEEKEQAWQDGKRKQSMS